MFSCGCIDCHEGSGKGGTVKVEMHALELAAEGSERPRCEEELEEERAVHPPSPIRPCLAKAENIQPAPVISNEEPLPPQVLHLASPNHQQFCTGVYTLDHSVRPNGKPLWKKENGDVWIYYGRNGRWYLGGKQAAKKDFACMAGFIRQGSGPGDMFPHQVRGRWEWGDSSSWHEDPDIAVNLMSPEEKAGWDREEARRLEAEARAYEEEREAAIAAFLKENGFEGMHKAKRSLMKMSYPLHCAAERGLPKMVRFLLEEGADPSRKNSAGKTAAQVAKSKDSKGSHAAVLRELNKVANRRAAEASADKSGSERITM